MLVGQDSLSFINELLVGLCETPLTPEGHCRSGKKHIDLAAVGRMIYSVHCRRTHEGTAAVNNVGLIEADIESLDLAVLDGEMQRKRTTVHQPKCF